jgi:hypothetical protein
VTQSAPLPRPDLFGIDHSSHPPAPAALKREGVRFVCRYLSTPGNSKNITLVEATDLKLAGIDVVLVFETGGSRALGGRAAGAADAQSARAQAGLVGLAGTPIYFAVDFDAQHAQLPAVLAYLQGAASVLGHDLTGVYGGLAAVKAALDAGACRYAWQTYAWSGGVWDPRAHLHQYADGQTLCGISVDFDRANAPDFGQHKGQPPTQPKAAGTSPAHTGRENVPGPAPSSGGQPKPAGTSPAHTGSENVPGPERTVTPPQAGGTPGKSELPSAHRPGPVIGSGPLA